MGATTGAAVPEGSRLHGLERHRLERAINRARWVGGVIALATGPVFPNLGWAYVLGLAGGLFAYAAVMHRASRTASDRTFRLAFWADIGVILFAMLTFSPDGPWTTFVFGILVIMVGGFRYGGPGAFASAVVLGLGYALIAYYRELAFGYAVEIPRIGTHISAYLLAALLMAGITRELHALRGIFEPLLAAQGDLGEGIVVNEAGRSIYWNDAIGRLTGFSRDELGALANVWQLVVPRARDAVARALADPARTGKIETFLRRKDGTEIPVELAFAPVATALGQREIVLVRDVIETKRAYAALRDEALHERLTGLPNRTLLEDRLEQALASARRYGGECSLLLLGLDNFTSVNEVFGHHAGDTAMPQIAARLVGEVRALDTVARLAGDEFAVLLPGADTASAVAVARKILRTMERPFAMGEQTVGLGASVGIVTFPTHGADPGELLRHAEIAHQAAKGTTDGYVAYSGSEPDPDGLLSAPALRRAIQDDDLVIHYQPEVRLADRAVVRFEALVRLRSGGVLVSPAEFIPLAERRGLIGALTIAVLGGALRDLQTWRAAGSTAAVAVNVSARKLLDPEFPSDIARLCASTGTEPGALVLEITESVLMAEPARAREALLSLRSLGVKLALDDFGTGYSSLGYLHRLPLDSMKIDRSFVAGLDAGSDAWAIVRAMIDLGRHFGLEIVAEGVEDGRSLDRLAVMGIDTAQGHHIAPPMPLAEAVAWLEAQRAPSPEPVPLSTASRRLTRVS